MSEEGANEERVCTKLRTMLSLFVPPSTLILCCIAVSLDHAPAYYYLCNPDEAGPTPRYIGVFSRPLIAKSTMHCAVPDAFRTYSRMFANVHTGQLPQVDLVG